GMVEEVAGPSPESGGGLLALVFQQLAVGQPRMVVDGVVDVPVTGPALAVALALRAAEDLVATAVGYAAELLDVHVHQIARRLVLVAGRAPRVRPDRGTGGRIGERQAHTTVAGQDLVHRGRLHPQVVSDPGRPPPARHP